MTRRHFLLDMDGVLVRGATPVPGAAEFLARLDAAGRRYLVLTNNPLYTPQDLSHRLRTGGFDVPADRIFTSAMATARFLADQRPGGKAFVIGDSGLTTALHQAGYVITDIEPDYVVLGESHEMTFSSVSTAVQLLVDGALFVATNPDTAGPTERGIVPAAGAVAAMISAATGVSPYVVGKPNPFMFRAALNHLDVHSEDTYMVGDNLLTDIKGGLEAGMETVLVMSGMTGPDDALARSPYQPHHVVESVAEIELG
ncbi:HAD-IIA family hydrolase [Salsipaludibacter albus]|uniref:HAD-IIA family hydrolase n=1 Tax=Salsipaludibacter albus TaxID=2849650 RepID=UPI001EE3D508|nr:HAD-IIA family hydrolase [Salsipaludibacter albus]